MVKDLVHDALIVDTAFLQSLHELILTDADLVLHLPRMQLVVDELVDLLNTSALRGIAAGPPHVDQVLLLLIDILRIFVVYRQHAQRLELCVQIIQLPPVEWSPLRELVDILTLLEELFVFPIHEVHVALLLALALQSLTV